MDTEKTHVRLLAMNSNLKKCRVYIDREEKSNESTKRMFAALMLSAYPRQRRVVDTRCVPHCGLRMGLELYSPRWLRVLGIWGSPVSHLVSFFRALYAVRNYISGWFVSEGRDAVSVSTLVYSVLSVVPGAE